MKKISDLSPKERQQLLQFNFTGGPLEDLEGAIPAFTAFGLAAMAWARLETHLDALLVHLNKRQFSKEIFDPKHPVSFSRKLDLLKKWFGRHKALTPYKAAIDKLAGQMKILGNRRNQSNIYTRCFRPGGGYEHKPGACRDHVRAFYARCRRTASKTLTAPSSSESSHDSS